jgi:hypothetical protein
VASVVAKVTIDAIENTEEEGPRNKTIKRKWRDVSGTDDRFATTVRLANNAET